MRLARSALLDALSSAAIAGPLALDDATDVDIAVAARGAALPAGADPGLGDLLLDAQRR